MSVFQERLFFVSLSWRWFEGVRVKEGRAIWTVSVVVLVEEEEEEDDILVTLVEWLWYHVKVINLRNDILVSSCSMWYRSYCLYCILTDYMIHFGIWIYIEDGDMHWDIHWRIESYHAINYSWLAGCLSFEMRRFWLWPAVVIIGIHVSKLCNMPPSTSP